MMKVNVIDDRHGLTCLSVEFSDLEESGVIVSPVAGQSASGNVGFLIDDREELKRLIDALSRAAEEWDARGAALAGG